MDDELEEDRKATMSMGLSDEQKRLARVADSIAGMLEQAFRLVPNDSGQAGKVFVEEATVPQGDEEVDRAMLWGQHYMFGNKPVELSGFHLNVDEHSYRVFIEEL